ncbi:ClpP class serine protease [Pedobacter sp. UYP24]
MFFVLPIFLILLLIFPIGVIITSPNWRYLVKTFGINIAVITVYISLAFLVPLKRAVTFGDLMFAVMIAMFHLIFLNVFLVGRWKR